MNFIAAVVSVTVVFASSSAFAFPSAVGTKPCGLKKDQFADVRQTVKFFDERDGNTSRTFEEYARANREEFRDVNEVKKAFSGSGRITCGDGTASAQLIEKNDIVATAAHVFFDSNCKRLPVQDCKFQKLHGSTEWYPIKVESAKNVKCVQVGDVNAKDDWAAVQTVRQVKNVTPYLLPRSPAKARVTDKLIQVSASADTFRDGQTPYISTCEVIGINRTHPSAPRMNVPVATNCGVGPGASGAGQFRKVQTSEGTRYEFHAMSVKENTRIKDGDVADINTSRFNASAEVSEDFYKALEDLIERKEITSLQDKGVKNP